MEWIAPLFAGLAALAAWGKPLLDLLSGKAEAARRLRDDLDGQRARFETQLQNTIDSLRHEITECHKERVEQAQLIGSLQARIEALEKK